MGTEGKKREPWGSISCARAEMLMEKQQKQVLDPFERNALFAHCTECDVCRVKQQKILDELIAKSSAKDTDE